MKLITRTYIDPKTNAFYEISKRNVIIGKNDEIYYTLNLKNSDEIQNYIKEIQEIINNKFTDSDLSFIKQFDLDFESTFFYHNFMLDILIQNEVKTEELPSTLIRIYQGDDYGRDNGMISEYMTVDGSMFRNERGLRITDDSIYNFYRLNSYGYKTIKDKFGITYGIGFEFVNKDDLEKKLKEAEKFKMIAENTINKLTDLLKQF